MTTTGIKSSKLVFIIISKTKNIVQDVVKLRTEVKAWI